MRLRLLCLLLLLAGVAFGQETLAVGKKVPDFELVNQDSKPVKLSQYLGKVVVITFLYTRCPYPEKCQMLAEKLGKTRALLEKLQAGDNLQVLSITIDPEHDTPDRLKLYAQGNERSASNWAFLTGKPADVAKIAAMFGVIYWDEKGVVEHNMRTAIIDRQGKLHTLIRGNDWKPGEVSAVIKDLLPK